MQKRDIHDGRWLMALLALAAFVIVAGLHSSSLKDEKTAQTLTTVPLVASADPTSFLSTWRTTTWVTGCSSSDQIRLPLKSNGTYNFVIHWGDGCNNTITAWNQTEVLHTYSSTGVKYINITGTCWGFAFCGSGDRVKLEEISQWGSLRLGNSGGYFYGCTLLHITATDVPDLTGCSNMNSAFFNCMSLQSVANMDAWNTSGVTNMGNMFYNAQYFNQSIENWDVSNVRNMDNMFYQAYDFNQPIGDWNVSRVTNMYCMFDEAIAFNKPLANWNVSSVTNMEAMFAVTYAFNQPIGNWNVSKVTNMGSMFSSAHVFNQPIGNWSVSSVTNMEYMFIDAYAFNQPIGNWDVSKVTNMMYMFSRSYVFNRPLASWDVSHVTNMMGMFAEATAFNQPLASWNVSRVMFMEGMFAQTSFNQNIGGWNVSRVRSMGSMFYQVTLSVSNYDALILGWSMLPLQSNVSFHGGNSKYSADATAARAFLISFFNWTILDGGLSDSPTVTHPDDVIYVHRTTGNQISWVVTDPTTGTRSFTIYRNGSSVSSGSWTSGIAVVRNVDGLAVGSYSYRIIAYDGQSGSVSDTVLVTVLNAAPTVSTPSDITFTEGQTGNAISWIITDWSTGTKSYSIYRNDTSIVNGSWTSGISVTQSLNGLAIGSFNYSIIAWDGLGGVVVDEIIVSVVNGNPIITHPADVSYVVGQTSRAISWIITDASMGPLLYTVYQNGISTVNGSWVSGVAVVMNVDGLAIGSYNFTIIARDGYGASSADSVFVTVTSQPSLATPGYPIVGVLTCLVIGIAITGLTTRWQNAISHKKNQ